MYNKITATLLSESINFINVDKINEEIINLIKVSKYDNARELINNFTIDNKAINNNVFNFLIKEINRRHDSIYTSLLLSILNQSSFIINGENIRQCIRCLPENFAYHNEIINTVKKQKFIENLSLKERTDILLMISEYYHHKFSYKNYKMYINLFTDIERKQCQQYFIENFESYFNNCYSNIKTTEEVSLVLKQLIKEVLVENNYKENKDKNLKTPKQENILLGENIKYINMLIVLWYFHKQQKKVKYGYACLFKSVKKFFIFFSQHIKPHYNCDNHSEIITFLQDMQKKYNFASISWENRYFYEKDIEKIKNTMIKAFDKSLAFFGIKDFYSIHLQLCSTHLHKFDGQYWNPFTSRIYHNTHMIIMESLGFHDFESTWIHELTHFLHFQQKNQFCFYHPNFKKIKDILYLHQERNNILQKLDSFLQLNNNENSEIVGLFNNYLHSSEKTFDKQLNKISNNIYSPTHIEYFKSLFIEYKSYNYKKSKQYLKWEDCAKKEKIGFSYFNKNHEIHARLNEILSGNMNSLSYNINYLTSQSVRFELLKNELIAFNNYLLERIK